MLRPDHPETLRTRSNIAACRAKTGELTPVLTDFERLLLDQERALDPGHPVIQRTRNWIAHLRERLETQSAPPKT